MIFKIGLPLLALGALTFALVSVERMTPKKVEAAPPSVPPSAAFSKQVGAVGLVEAATENIAISVPVPGLVTKVTVKAGDRVRQGQALFTLDDRDLRAELALREATVGLARTRLQRLESAPRPEEIPPAEARVDEARANLADTQTQLRLIESVKDRRAIREEDLQKRLRAVDSSKAKLEEAEAALRLLKAGTWKPDLEVARQEVAEGEQRVQRIRADIARLTITAPIDGVILQCKVRPGEYAQAGVLAQPLILMGNVDTLHIRADIDEKDAWRLRPGVQARASVRGNAAKRYDLAFVRIEPYVIPKKNLTGDATERVDTRVLQAIYALPKGAPVYPGQQMDLSIEAVEGDK
ncbi:MAG TPA: efflux RND transporter periplasmic adaptor subunit [Bryobacteraceae bacterium]|nr:efflux RND transporter periplasmic adaptor subunit [Bryobacteraceae bacterium]